MSAEEPSKFWEQLAEEDRRAFDSHRFDGFKRHQALRFFT